LAIDMNLEGNVTATGNMLTILVLFQGLSFPLISAPRHSVYNCRFILEASADGHKAAARDRQRDLPSATWCPGVWRH
jgi:hypothetical protein